MTATTRIAAPHIYTDPAGRTWDLDRDALDFHAAGWEWDGQPYDPATGPVLHTIAAPVRTEPLLVLANCSALWQVPLGAAQDLAHWMDPHDTTADLLRWAGAEVPA
jgi:hypothetical protein